MNLLARLARRAALVGALAVGLSAVATEAAAGSGQGVARGGADREILPLADDLFRVRAGGQETVFLVTDEGIVLVDPLSRETAEWLRGEFDRRFPGRPVRWVIHTSHRYYRAEGAALFDDAGRLAHEGFRSALQSARGALPPVLRSVDLNGNGRLERFELLQAPAWAMLEHKDLNGDGVITASELSARISDANVTFTGAQTLRLGGRQIDVVHVPSLQAPDMIVVHFRDARLLFAEDLPPLLLPPFTFDAWRPRDVFTWLDTVLTLDAERLVSPRGELDTGELTSLAGYFRALRDDVTTRYRAGGSLRALQMAPLPAAYAGSPLAVASQAQVEALYRELRWFGMEVSGRMGTGYTSRQRDTCEGYTSCAGGGAVAGGSLGLGIAINRRTDVLAEITFNQQAWGARTSPSHDEEFALRFTTGAFLLRVRAAHLAGVLIAPVGGVSWRTGDLHGIRRVKGVLAPIGGRHEIQARDTRFGFAGGVDIARSVTERIGVLIPLRVVQTRQELPERWSGRVELQAGVGLSLALVQRVQ